MTKLANRIMEQALDAEKQVNYRPFLTSTYEEIFCETNRRFQL